MTSAIDQPAIPVRRRQATPWLRHLMVFFTCVVAADALFGERGLAERARTSERYLAAQQELDALKQENSGLRDYIRRLNTDPATIESIAREDFGLAKPGELLVIIRDKEK
jgi:cell division protein FtsB